MPVSIVLGLLAAAQVPAEPPRQLQKECGLSGAVAPSRELRGLWVARAPAAETLACLDSWVSRTKAPIAVVTTEPAGVPWDLPADLEGERPSGMLVEGDSAAVAAARAEAERLGLPVRAWRDTAEPAAILVGSRNPMTDLAEKVRSGALGRLEVGHYSIWDVDAEVSFAPDAPLPLQMVFTGPAAQLDPLEAELRRDGWTVEARAASGATVFIQASIAVVGLLMPDVLARLGTGDYSEVRSAYLGTGGAIGFLGNEAQ